MKQIKSLIATLVFLCFFSNTLLAETALVVKAGRYLDVQSGEMISPAVFVIEDGLIAGINPQNLPDDARILELGDLTLLPGFMDMHSHITLDYFNDDHWTTAPVMETSADWALHGVKFGGDMLNAGFTTVRDAGGFPGFPDVALMRAIDKGHVIGPRMFPAGHYISITGGHCDITGFAPGIMELGPQQGIADGKDELLKAIRYQAKHGVKVIKVCATAGVFSKGNSPGAQQYSDEELQVIVEESTRHGLKVMAHAHGSEGIMAAVKAGVASIEHGSMLTPEIIQEMKTRGTYYVPTIHLNDVPLPPETPEWTVKKNEFLKPHVETSFKLALKHKINIALGSDAGVMQHKDARLEFHAMVKRGMSPLHAIQSTTINAAGLLGVSDRGQLKAGMLADMVAVEGDPLENIRILEDVKVVIKGGKIIKGE
ncbi:metal-dependent hydrolase family protein [Lacimicrobium alkaliphilum]|uniref:Amidohydrolase n=1 Tax=Lacimicrobium alkaliphilum TaxID=1526571 RepID=A0ABQ1QYV6_9ALTE|nr:amidohydrolase family protein [Lacimicrobium alkaliphilum]GGD52236.1 amidohydrolase [Lacimicrobium alkaliphilum]